MDGGAWKAAVHGVAEGRTQLSDFTFTFHFHALEKEMATHSSVLSWRIPGTGEPGGLPSMGSHRVGHDWSDLAAAEYLQFTKYFTYIVPFAPERCTVQDYCLYYSLLFILLFLFLIYKDKKTDTHRDYIILVGLRHKANTSDSEHQVCFIIHTVAGDIKLLTGKA